MYVASGFDPDRGFPRPILNRVAERGDGWFPTRMSPASFETGFERVREAVADADRDPGAVEGAYYLNAIVDESREAALDRAVAFYEAYYPRWEKPREKLAGEGVYGTSEEVDERLNAGVEPFVVRFPTANQRDQLRRFSEML